MTTQQAADAPPTTTEQPARNEVRLTGRISSGPEMRTLPSGSEICTVRLVVLRARVEQGRARSDWIACTAWTARTRATLSRWSVGDEVEVEGALRRRHYRTGGGAGSLVEVEVSSARRHRP